jgi:hypothetical protein
VPLEITPQPAPQEREALLRALVGGNAETDRGSRWWEAGIREAVEEPAETETAAQASARPRRSAGASRA